MTPPCVRTGGSLPVVRTLEQQEVPLVLTGFAPSEARVHSANERFLVHHLRAGVSLAMELLQALSDAGAGATSGTSFASLWDRADASESAVAGCDDR